MSNLAAKAEGDEERAATARVKAEGARERHKDKKGKAVDRSGKRDKVASSCTVDVFVVPPSAVPISCVWLRGGVCFQVKFGMAKKESGQRTTGGAGFDNADEDAD